MLSVDTQLLLQLSIPDVTLNKLRKFADCDGNFIVGVTVVMRKILTKNVGFVKRKVDQAFKANFEAS